MPMLSDKVSNDCDFLNEIRFIPSPVANTIATAVPDSMFAAIDDECFEGDGDIIAFVSREGLKYRARLGVVGYGVLSSPMAGTKAAMLMWVKKTVPLDRRLKETFVYED